MLKLHFGIKTYISGSPTFEPLGDENGLFICVALDRNWFPTTIKSQAFPAEIILDFDKKVDFEYENYRVKGGEL